MPPTAIALDALHRDGRLEPLCPEAAGEPLPPCNGVLLDRERSACSPVAGMPPSHWEWT